MIPSEILRDLDDPVHSSHHKKKKKHKHKHKTDTPVAEKKNKSNKRPTGDVNNGDEVVSESTPVKKVLRPPPLVRRPYRSKFQQTKISADNIFALTKFFQDQSISISYFPTLTRKIKLTKYYGEKNYRH